jgi:hypothetical protein
MYIGIWEIMHLPAHHHSPDCISIQQEVNLALHHGLSFATWTTIVDTLHQTEVGVGEGGYRKAIHPNILVHWSPLREVAPRVATS